MASGLPLVACNRGGVISCAAPSCAWLADPAPRSFGEAIRSLARCPAERQARVPAALETARRYAWADIAGGYLQLYREIHEWHSGACPNPRIQPDFISTAGNWLGLEV